MRVRLPSAAGAVTAVLVLVALMVLGGSCSFSGESSGPRPGPTTSTSAATTTTAPLAPCPRREAQPVGWSLASSVAISSPVVVGDTLVVGTRSEKTGVTGCVVGVSAANGDLRWRVDEALAAGAPVVGVGADLVVLPLARRVAAVDRLTGQERWSVPARPVSSFAVGDGFVVAVDLDRTVAIDVATGRVLWERPRGGAGAVADGASVFVSETAEGGTGKWVTRSLVGKTGAEKWNVQAADGNAVVVAVAPSVVAAEQAPNTLAVVDKASGRQLWTLNVPGGQSATPVAVGAALVVRSDDGNVYAYDAVRRTPHWRTPVGGARPTRPSVAGGLVFTTGFAPEPTLFALDARTGRQRWKAALPTSGGNEVTPPLAFDSSVAVGAGGVVAVYDQATGKPVATHELPQGVRGELARFDRTLFANLRTDSIAALPI